MENNRIRVKWKQISLMCFLPGEAGLKKQGEVLLSPACCTDMVCVTKMSWAVSKKDNSNMKNKSKCLDNNCLITYSTYYISEYERYFCFFRVSGRKYNEALLIQVSIYPVCVRKFLISLGCVY